MTTMIQEIKNIIEDARQIESATGYGECLYHQNRCDSSVRRNKRMVFVKQAEAEFIKANKKEILKNAAKLCRESIGDISELITLKQLDTVEVSNGLEQENADLKAEVERLRGENRLLDKLEVWCIENADHNPHVSNILDDLDNLRKPEPPRGE